MANHNQYKSVLVDRFEEFHPLSTQQWGFTHGKSITGTLLTATDNWHRLDSGFDTCAVFFDFSKAFDSVPHRPLLQKLKDLKVHSHILKWLTHYLSFRHQYVCVNSSLSDILPVYSGVPQGSFLGPLLFIVYVSDITMISLSDGTMSLMQTTFCFTTQFTHLPTIMICKAMSTISVL